MPKNILMYLRLFAIFFLSAAIFLAVADYKIVSNEANAQCLQLIPNGYLTSVSSSGSCAGSWAACPPSHPREIVGFTTRNPSGCCGFCTNTRLCARN